tara:strand:+ start:3206 stop:5695 length:2490 start_codon:yes stop_codon:yes gene_type:complete
VTETTLRFKVETLDANAKIAHLTKKVQGLEVAVKKAGGSTHTAAAGFKAFSGGAQAAAVGARGLGAALGAALGPITAVVAAAGSLGRIFGVLSQQDFAEAKVRSLGVNSKELTSRLKDVSGELSGQASVVELTGAAYDVASAGFADAADAANILKAASLGATGGFSDINTVGDATTSVLNAYGLEADKAAQLVDGFIQTQNDGKIVIGQYAANIAKVAPVAAALGVPLEEVNAAVAQITAGGQNAEMTFTALKTALSKVAAGNVGKEFKKLGVEINTSTLKSDGLAGTLEKIKKSGADAGTIIKAFGTEAGPSILALLNDTEKYNKLLENQKNAQGKAAAAAFEASDTINGQLKRLQTAFENIFSDQSELGFLLKQTFKIAAVTVEVFGLSLAAVLTPVRALVAFVQEVGSAVSQALGLDGVNAAFELEKAFQANMKRIRQAQAFVVGLGKVIGGVVGGAAKVVVETGKKALDAVGGFFQSTLGRIVGFIKTAYALIPEPIQAFLEGGVKTVTGTIGGIGKFVQDTVALGSGVTGGGSGAGQQPQGLPGNAVQPTGGKLGKEKKLTEEQKKQAKMAKLAEQIEKKALATQERKRQAFEDQFRSIDDRRAILGGILNGNEQEVKNAILLRDLIRKHGVEKGKILYQNELNVQQLEEQVKKQKELNDAQKAFAEDLDQTYKSIGDSIKTGVVDSITAAVEGTKSLAEVATNTLRNIGQTLLQFGISTLFSSLVPGGGILAKMFGRANGGTVRAGRPYVVGERGPELFTPNRSGSISPNDAMGGASVTVNVDASGSSVQGDGQNAAQLGKAIGLAVQAELRRQQRPGGILAR